MTDAEAKAALRQRLEDVRARIASACAQAGRSPADVQLLAVSKTQPAASIAAMQALGVDDFGENYAQELVAKAQALRGSGARFAFIGSIQSNKLKGIVEHASEIQSVGSERHARLVEKYARELGRTPYPIYLAVNAGDEASKSGIALDAAPALAHLIETEMPGLALQGLMAIPPPLETLELEVPQGQGGISVPKLYGKLKELSLTMGRGKLSLGMTQDLAEAIAAGATCVRVGTALFGARPPKAT